MSNDWIHIFCTNIIISKVRDNGMNMVPDEKVTRFSFEIFTKVKVAESLNDIDLSALNQNEIIQLETILTSNTSKFSF